MHISILGIVGILFVSALAAVLALFRWAFKMGEAPSDKGPRALISEFVGNWIGFSLILGSFFLDKTREQWTLRIFSAIAIVVGLVLSDHFAETAEVPESPDREPTGFKNNMTDIGLK